MFDSIILAIAQGISEFLPISSSGHLVVLQYFLGIKEHNLSFDIAVHLGTLASVLTIYRKNITEIFVNTIEAAKKRQVNASARLVGLVLVASVPAAVLGIGFKSFFAGLFESINAVIVGFVITGFFLMLTAIRGRGQMGSHFVENIEKANKITFWQAIVVGCAQAVAIAPGISRAGMTISSGIIIGLDRSTAAFFSFMMAIPVIAGAGLLEARNLVAMSAAEMQVFAVGILTAYIFGIIGLKLVLTFVRQGRLHFFALYVWALALFLYFKATI